jgi:hypothetical protein
MTTAAELQLGDHVCLPFGADEQLQCHINDFTAGGLADRQQVMVFTQAVTVADMAGWLRRQNRAFAAALDAGQLQVHRPDDVHLAGGHFDQHRMMANFAQTTDQAYADGYSGLRVTVDMTWALQDVPGVEQLFDFEAAANRLFTDRRLNRCLRVRPAALRHRQHGPGLRGAPHHTGPVDAALRAGSGARARARR